MNKKYLFILLLCLLASSVAAQVRALPSDSSQAIADRIVKSAKPVLIDFWAPWCGPCRLIEPIIKEIKKKYAGRITVMKINVDIHRQIAAYFRITAIPAIFFVKDAKVVKYLPGVQSKKTYYAAINEVLAMKSAAADTAAAKKKQPDKKPENAVKKK